MKKSLILLPLAAVLLTLTGCKKDNEKSGPSSETVTLSATLGGGEKTEIYDGTKMKWSEGDEVNINGESYTAKFSFDDGTYTQATFEDVNRAEDGKYYAYYPASLYKSGSYVLPSTQTYYPENGNVLSDISPMYAVTDTKVLQFHNICALVKLQVTGEGTVKKIFVTSSDDPLCGTFTVSESESNGKYYAEISEGSKTVILDCGAGVELENENPTTFYIALPQGTLRGLKFTFVNGSDAWESESIATASLTAGKLYTKSLEKGDYDLTNGALNGVFSVSATKKVHFSKGNLTYNVNTKEWAFYEKQTDCPSSYSSTLISLFTWGYGSWSTVPKTILYQTGSFTDWGCVAIKNGGNAENFGWFTLNNDMEEVGGVEVWHSEWYYLFNERTNASKLRSTGTVEGKSGGILLPDDWVLPEDLTFTSNDNSYTKNVYTTEQWTKMEAAGAVFLPIAGGSYQGSYYNYNEGLYWSSTPYPGERALGVYVSKRQNFFIAEAAGPCHDGCSVRLVLPVDD